MLRNKIAKKDCEIVLRNADTVINLNNSVSILNPNGKHGKELKIDITTLH